MDSAGKVILFSHERFERDIGLGECCFICGASPDEKQFNEEHILPEWILRRYQLFDKTIVLPNHVSIRYGGYTVSCCRDCNELMGDMFEVPISRAAAAGTAALTEYVLANQTKVFVWLGLIFLKSHLRDRSVRFHLDKRKGGEAIADAYDWNFLYHIHAVTRQFYTNALMQREVMGSFLGIPVKLHKRSEQFDYSNLYLFQTSMMRLDDLALLTVFDDSAGALGFVESRLSRITGPVSEIQARELMVELAFLNMHIKQRPEFSTFVDVNGERCALLVKRPKMELETLDYTLEVSSWRTQSEKSFPKSAATASPLTKLRGAFAPEDSRSFSTLMVSSSPNRYG